MQSPPPPVEILNRIYRELRDEVYVAEEMGRQRSHQRYLRLIMRYARGSPGRLLDVGCSAGLFLQLAQQAEWSVLGIEPSVWLAQQAEKRLGNCVLNTTFEDAVLPPQSLDIVSAWDVLEHVKSPVSFVQKAAMVLKPGGLLAVNVPDIGSIIARLFGSHWPLLLPEHLYYYSRQSLRLLLESQGFTVLAFHLHPVFFSIGYILHRLDQHDIRGVRLVSGLLGAAAIRNWSVPLLMGEVTVIAESSG